MIVSSLILTKFLFDFHTISQLTECHAVRYNKARTAHDYVDHTDLKNGKFGGTFIAKCDYKNTDLAKLIKTDTKINSYNMNTWSEVGVVVRTDKDSGQTYIAISAVFKFKT